MTSPTPPTPAQAFAAWVQAQCRTAPAGTPLPPERELAAHWHCSVATIRRVLHPFVESGQVVRVRGSGSWIHGLPPRHNTPRAGSSVDHLADTLCARISAGHLKVGETLPLVKEIAGRNRCAPATAIAALRRLMSEGLVHKSGRSYRVGGVHAAPAAYPSRVAAIYSCNGTFLDMASASELRTPAYRAMELELNRHGRGVVYRPLDRLPDLLRTRASDTATIGTMISWMSAGLYDEWRERLRRSVRAAAPSERLLVVTGSHRRPPRGMYQLCTGNVTTVRARRLAEYIRDLGCRSVCYFQRYPSIDMRDYAYAIKILRDITHFCRGIDLMSRVQISRRVDKVRRRFRQHSAAFARVYRNGFLSKYPSFSFDTFYPRCEVACGDTFDFSACTRWKLWVFDRDADAVAALHWLKRKGLSVPRHYQLITLEGGDEHFGAGLTMCVSDWQTTGYLMAHALLGDIPVARTSHGFLRTEARVFPRRTTRGR